MKSVRKRKTNIVYESIYTESRKMVLMNLFAGMERRRRCTERACGHSRAGGDRGQESIGIHTQSWIKWVTGKQRLYDAGSPVWYSGMT